MSVPPARRDSKTIRALVVQSYTGNRPHDLAGFRLDEFARADEEWHAEAARAYEREEQKKKHA